MNRKTALKVGLGVIVVVVLAVGGWKWRSIRKSENLRDRVRDLVAARESPMFWMMVPRSPPIPADALNQRWQLLNSNELWGYFVCQRLTVMLDQSEYDSADEGWVLGFREAVFLCAHQARFIRESGRLDEAEWQRWVLYQNALNAYVEWRGLEPRPITRTTPRKQIEGDMAYRVPYPLDMYRPQVNKSAETPGPGRPGSLEVSGDPPSTP